MQWNVRTASNSFLYTTRDVMANRVRPCLSSHLSALNSVDGMAGQVVHSWILVDLSLDVAVLRIGKRVGLLSSGSSLPACTLIYEVRFVFPE